MVTSIDVIGERERQTDRHKKRGREREEGGGGKTREICLHGKNIWETLGLTELLKAFELLSCILKLSKK